MKYLEVERVGRPETEGQRRQAACRGKEDRSPIRCVLPFWSLSLRPDLAISLSVCWVKFFFLQVRFLSFFQHLLVFGRPLVSDFSILGFFFFFFLFLRICGFATSVMCWACHLFFFFFFFFLRIRGLAACSVTIFFFFFQILVQNFFQAFLFLFNLRVFLIFFKG